MTYRTLIGISSHRYCLARWAIGGVWLKITVNSSMPCCGFFALVRLGETYPLIMEIGRIHIVDLVVGEIVAFGNQSWNRSLITQTTNG